MLHHGANRCPKLFIFIGAAPGIPGALHGNLKFFSQIARAVVNLMFGIGHCNHNCVGDCHFSPFRHYALFMLSVIVVEDLIIQLCDGHTQPIARIPDATLSNIAPFDKTPITLDRNGTIFGQPTISATPAKASNRRPAGERNHTTAAPGLATRAARAKIEAAGDGWAGQRRDLRILQYLRL
jgi:hypothetical protein